MTDDIKISVRNLYKIFGDDPQGALEKVRGLAKASAPCGLSRTTEPSVQWCV